MGQEKFDLLISRVKWCLTQALELYDKGEALHWAPEARKLLSEIAGNTVVKEYDCGCIVIKSPTGLCSIIGQDEGIKVNPLATPFGYSDEVIAKWVLKEFCPH
jgi:hypothetical protein